MTDSIDGSGNYRGTYPDPYASERTQTTKTTGQTLNMLMGDKQEVSVNDFLNLMVAQIKNQDFMNPMEDMDFVTQMAQFATMQQMQELASYSKSNYVSSLLGKTVTASKFTVSGDTNTQKGPIQKISLVNDEYTVTVNGENYSLAQIMEIHSGDSNLLFDASNMEIETETLTKNWVELKWPVPTTDEEVADTLTYSVYYSTKKLGSTPEEIAANGTLSGRANRKHLTGEIISGLLEGTDYYISVVVSDTAGNKSVYKPLMIQTEGVAEKTETGDTQDTADKAGEA